MKKALLVLVGLVLFSNSAFATVSHISFNDQTSTYGRMLRRVLFEQEDSLNSLNEILATMALMIDGDGSDPAQFSYMASKFGFDSTTTAKAGWDELNSMASKINTDSSVDHVNTALKQAYNKFR
jgi:hypothetical protein